MPWPFRSDSDYVFYTLECSVKEMYLMEVFKKLGRREYKLRYCGKSADGLAFELETDIGGTLTEAKKFVLPISQRALIVKAVLIEVSHRAYSSGGSRNERGQRIEI